MKNTQVPSHFSSAHHSLFQSAVREAELELNQTESALETRVSGLFSGVDKQQAITDLLKHEGVEEEGLFDTVKTCASLSMRLVEAHISRDKEKIEALESQFKFSSCDVLGWTKVIENYLKHYWGDATPMYRSYAPEKIDTSFVYDIPDAPLKVGVIGDWGTGELVAEVVLEEVFKHEPDILIHVGDIYYSGTSNEARTNFLDPINRARAKDTGGKSRQIPVYNLPGNHDYYAGGQGFYDTIDELNRPPYVPSDTPRQEASFFCLRNSNWQLQGMDTGYYDHDVFKVGRDFTRLHDSEIAWHQNKLASADDRKVILFSHHQLFSAFEKINNTTLNPDLYVPFEPALKSGQIAAWLWGHEHLLEIYGPYLGLPVGRCIGNGAFPELVSSEAYDVLKKEDVGPVPPLLTDPNGEIYKTGSTDEVFNHGYAILELGDQDATASYYQVPGDGTSQTSSLVLEETIR